MHLTGLNINKFTIEKLKRVNWSCSKIYLDIYLINDTVNEGKKFYSICPWSSRRAPARMRSGPEHFDAAAVAAECKCSCAPRRPVAAVARSWTPPTRKTMTEIRGSGRGWNLILRADNWLSSSDSRRRGRASNGLRAFSKRKNNMTDSAKKLLEGQAHRGGLAVSVLDLYPDDARSQLGSYVLISN